MLESAHLTHDELLFYAENGFIVKKGLVSEKLCDDAIKIAFQYLPKHFNLADSTTWNGPVTCSCNYTQNLTRRRGHVKIQQDRLANEVVINNLVEKNTNIQSILSQLLGTQDLEYVFRGLYFTFPISKWASIPYTGHIESHPMQVGTVVYCNDVKERGGGLAVWPGSHWDFQTVFNAELGFKARKSYFKVIKKFNSRSPYVITANKGDVIFTHHRLFHAPSNNNLSTLRSAYFCDVRVQNWKDFSQIEPFVSPFSQFPDLKNIPREHLQNKKVVYDSRPSLSRALLMSFPKVIKTLYSHLSHNKSVRDRSHLSYLARFREDGK